MDKAKLTINLELRIDVSNKIVVDKYVTNEWPCDLIMAVFGDINKRIKAYYEQKGDKDVLQDRK